MRLPVTLTPRPSPTLAAALLFAHGLAGAVTVSAGMPAMIAMPVLALVLASLGLSMWRHVYRSFVLALTLKADGALDVECRDRSCGVAAIAPHTTVFPWLVVLRLRIGARSVSLVLPADALGDAAHRQLRLWLRWKASAVTA